MKLPIIQLRFLLESLSNFLFNLTLSRLMQSKEVVRNGTFFVPLDDFGCPGDAVAKCTGNAKQILLGDFEAHKAAPAIPMAGYLTGDIMYDESKEIMRELEIECSSFLFEERVRASYPGAFRQALTWPKTLNISLLRRAHWRLSFFIKKGSYATVLLRELLKPRSPCLVGF